MKFKTFSPKSPTPTLDELLDNTLFKLPGMKDVITWADSVEGTFICGATGSGKSSGPGRYTAQAMLKNGFGMCVLCAKSDERERWEEYIKETGREKDQVIFNMSSGLKFNFLKYEMERKGDGGGDVLTLTEALMNLNEQSRIHKNGGGGNDERFWDNALRRLIARSISLLRLTAEEVSIMNMRKLVAESFKEGEVQVYSHLKGIIETEEKIDPNKRKEAIADFEKWEKTSYFLRLIEKLKNKTFTKVSLIQDADTVMDYWIKEFATLSDRTRSIVVESFMGIIDPFMSQGILLDQFSGGLSEELLPERIVTDKSIVIIDFPIKEFGISGIYAATIYKSVFQAAMERRKINQEEDPRPVGLFIDEYQTFCNPGADSLFQLTARSSWVASVYITQNINNIYFVMGQHMPQARAKGLLNNLNLKYFAGNSDAETNKWASEMIGRHYTDTQSITIGEKNSLSKTKNMKYDYKVTPDHFTSLKTGRKRNGYLVEAIVFKSGRVWGREKENFAMVSFDQRESDLKLK